MQRSTRLLFSSLFVVAAFGCTSDRSHGGPGPDGAVDADASSPDIDAFVSRVDGGTASDAANDVDAAAAQPFDASVVFDATAADDAAEVDAAEVDAFVLVDAGDDSGAPDAARVPGAPSIDRIGLNTDVLEPETTLILTVTASDPDGVTDLASGTVDDPVSMHTYGALRRIGAGLYELRLGWRDVQTVRSIDATARGVRRELRVTMRDNAGHETTQSAYVVLSCNREGTYGPDGDVMGPFVARNGECSWCGPSWPSAEYDFGPLCARVCSTGYGACGRECIPLGDTTRHTCGDVCADNASVATCGSSCSPCPSPADPNAMATCDGFRCAIACRAGAHDCGGTCVLDTDVASCGTSCTPCPSPVAPNTIAACIAGHCGTACVAGAHACARACVRDDDATACGTACAVCPGGPGITPICAAGRCGVDCADGYGPCTMGGAPSCCLGAPRAPRRSGELVISEFMANPRLVDDSVGEWIELYNTTSQPLELRGCTLRDSGSDSHVIARSLVIGPGSYVVLANGASSGATAVYTYDHFGLGNSGDEIELRCGDGVIDFVAYYPATWPVVAGASLALSSPVDAAAATRNDAASAWCRATTTMSTGDQGTPGAPNDCP